MPSGTLSKDDWSLLEALAEQSGVARERVVILRKRFISDQERQPSEGVCLLVGQQKVLELFLARWLSPEAARAMARTRGMPLIIGPSPENIRPALGIWPGFKIERIGVKGRHVLAVAADGKLSGSLQGALNGLRTIDLVVLVTRLAQPILQIEQEAALSLSTLAPIARVLYFGGSGDEITVKDAHELAAYALSRMQTAGFSAGRFQEAGLWFSDGTRELPNVIKDIERFLCPPDSDHTEAKRHMLHHALVALISDIEAGAEETQVQVESENEIPDTIRQFDCHLAALGKHLEDMASAGEFASTERLQLYFKNELHGWIAGARFQGETIRFAETLRPGIRASLKDAVSDTARLLEIRAAPDGKGTRPSSLKATESQLVNFATAIVAGFVALIAAFLVASVVFANWLASILAIIIGLAVALVAFIVRPIRLIDRFQPIQSQKSPPLDGWPAAQQRLFATFADRLSTRTVPIRTECARLRERLGGQLP